MSAEAAVSRSSAAGRWQSLHVHYSTDTRPLLVECLTPLVADLRSRGLLTSYFYVHDWVEGPHVRLRLKPTRVADTAEVLDRAEVELDRFLARRPVLTAPEPPLPYDELFALAPDRAGAYFDSTMPTQIPNTIHYRPYDPEYGRFGGPAGVDIAEWHFEHSSDLALEVLADAEPPAAVELTLIALSSLLRTVPAMRVFASRYQRHWQRAVPGSPEVDQRHVTELAASLSTLASRGRAHARWAEHCAELRVRLADASREGALMTPLSNVLGHYLRLTNNRLGLSPVDEAHLAATIAETLRASHLAAARS